MNKQNLFKKYKTEICKYCANKNENDCNIHITVYLSVKCCNYIKDKTKFKKRPKLTEW